MTPETFYARVECLCLLYDASVTSTIRTAQRNELVGGATHSRHMLAYGRAADLVPDDPDDLEALKEAAILLGFDYVEIGDSGKHVHVQVRV